MRWLLILLLFMVGGVGVGFFTASGAINSGVGPFSVRNGPWVAWPMAGNVRADPYTKAHFAATGQLPLIASEALSIRADADSQGEYLLGDCTYLLAGSRIEARLWTLAVYDEDGSFIENPAARHSFNSTNVLRDSEGNFEIVLAPQAQPGNWIPTSGVRRFFIMLRLYNAEPALIAELERAQLPEIKRIRCD